MPPDHASSDSPNKAGLTTRAPIIDKRTPPRGVLPRHVQTWLMAGLAVIIIAIIFVTGRPEPVPTDPAADTTPPAPALLPADRVRTYQQRLAEQEARLRQEQAAAAAQQADAVPSRAEDTARAAADALLEERRRRDYESLFADNVALSRRPPDQRPSVESPPRVSGPITTELSQAPPAWPLSPSMSSAAPSSALTGPPPTTAMTNPRPLEPETSDRDAATSKNHVDGARATEPIALAGPLHRLLEGTFIEAVLMNRLEGSFAGPITCLVTTPVYSHSRQHVVIPSGARVLGSASPVQAYGETRLAVRFHRLVMPDGRTYPLDRLTGLNQAGDTGLTDQVDRHYWQVFGASIAIGMLSGFAQYQTRGIADPEARFSDGYRQGVGSSLASSGGRIMDRLLNVLPTVTIREGHRVRVYLTTDMELPEYTER